MRTALMLAALLAVGAILISGGSRADSVRHQYLAGSNELRTVNRYGSAREVSVRSLGEPRAIRARPAWLARARPLAAGAPAWARRMYRRSLLVLHGLTDRDGAVIAGAREGWAYVWPRDAGTAAIAFAAAGYRSEARRVARFLL
ncbi:MAG TPA: glycoside hydrolase family 15 protein, partial [Solirubrobacterales bacterium]|nr:glycoside hydrolase family 15 protein [Solirubrobacterales bacterium]